MTSPDDDRVRSRERAAREAERKHERTRVAAEARERATPLNAVRGRFREATTLRWAFDAARGIAPYVSDDDFGHVTRDDDVLTLHHHDGAVLTRYQMTAHAEATWKMSEDLAMHLIEL